MSALNPNEKQILEKLFQMGSGYVLSFSDKTYIEFFRDSLNINIDDDKYRDAGSSKANRLRCFWTKESDLLVGRSITALLSHIETKILIGSFRVEDYPEQLVVLTKQIATKLIGGKSSSSATEDEFISKEFGQLPINKLDMDSPALSIIEQRVVEIKKCLTAKAPLAVIFLCGSTLEGILLGVAIKRPQKFNQSSLSPKDRSTGKVKAFQDWKLSEFINVARDLNLVGEDVKKFSHGLREFRNYIHPYEQLASTFSPDEHTASICWKVLQAAICQLAKSP